MRQHAPTQHKSKSICRNDTCVRYFWHQITQFRLYRPGYVKHRRHITSLQATSTTKSVSSMLAVKPCKPSGCRSWLRNTNYFYYYSYRISEIIHFEKYPLNNKQTEITCWIYLIYFCQSATYPDSFDYCIYYLGWLSWFKFHGEIRVNINAMIC